MQTQAAGSATAGSGGAVTAEGPLISKRTASAEVASYWDSVAARYLELFRSELAGKPYDLEILRRFAAAVGPGAVVCDAGCGPCAHVGGFLSGLGLRVFGADISFQCAALAAHERPEIPVAVMDLCSMAVKDRCLDGIVAYYSLHYHPGAVLEMAVREFHRVLRPGGEILVVAKQDEKEGWIDDPLGSNRKVFWKGFRPNELKTLISSAPFDIESVDVRESLPNEIAARRVYVRAARR